VEEGGQHTCSQDHPLGRQVRIKVRLETLQDEDWIIQGEFDTYPEANSLWRELNKRAKDEGEVGLVARYSDVVADA